MATRNNHHSCWHLSLGFSVGGYSAHYILSRFDPQRPSHVRWEESQHYIDQLTAPYMCMWAFELLRTHDKTRGLDFRRFQQRFAQMFGHLPARCLGLSNTPCDGLSPYNCRRFVGALIQDQSAHDMSFCSADSHDTVYWNDSSYRSTHGCCAVSLDLGKDGQLCYVPLSSSTLAISHVWSHGQGGRPETGFNRCLHRRYASIARHNGCDSYWMDTPCIPTDHILRHEAILHINEVFDRSKITLVCDRDLMAIDIGNIKMETKELILATLLVCDWNVRAWTLLEAVMASHKIYVLCKDNNIISLAETINSANKGGCPDIASLFLAEDHLIQDLHSSLERKEILQEPAHFSLERAAGFLCNRHASRPEDEIVIWSLLCGSKVSYTANDFGTNFMGTNRSVKTSFLMSSAPRLKNHRGLSWAPLRPDMDPSINEVVYGEQRHQAYDRISTWASITTEGLKGKWAILDFYINSNWPDPPATDEARLEACIAGEILLRSIVQLQEIVQKFIRPCKWGALLQAARDDFIQGIEGPGAIQYEGNVPGVLVAIVASDDRYHWEWKGVTIWHLEQELLPEFLVKEILIV